MFHRHRASVWEAEKVLEMMVRMVAQQCEDTECSQAVRVNTMLCVFCHHFSKRLQEEFFGSDSFLICLEKRFISMVLKTRCPDLPPSASTRSLLVMQVLGPPPPAPPGLLHQKLGVRGLIIFL